MNFHADFSVVGVHADYIYIRDNGGPNKSVTNDAEWVIEELHRHFAIAGKRVFYMDTLGQIDELVHDNGVFKRFKAGHEGCDL